MHIYLSLASNRGVRMCQSHIVFICILWVTQLLCLGIASLRRLLSSVHFCQAQPLHWMPLIPLMLLEIFVLEVTVEIVQMIGVKI
jgi:hypothetical protein